MFKFFRKSLNLNRIHQVPQCGKSKIPVVLLQKILRFEALLQVKLDACSYRFVLDSASIPGPAPVKIPFECGLNVIDLAWSQPFNNEVIAQCSK